MLNFKLPSFPSLDQIINQSPLAQAVGTAGAAVLGVADKPSVTQAVYDDLKYVLTAYAIILPGPPLIPICRNGQKLCSKEIIVTFRGTVTPANFITDALGMLVDGDTTHSKVHTAVSEKTVTTVTAELIAHAGYSIVATGHSLGGAMASLAGIALQMLFPNTYVKLYTYGQPRTGNLTYATLVNTMRSGVSGSSIRTMVCQQ
ncbi:Alpha/Beta hydrolase protein [Mycena maculata]|uniref:Alpha/Beta hydrolase protein n=1 Tax=Mycena maculata TaxID=230809 RepID=A0AAD7J175_9AGAR|nr:Alpha/Beta hydrolase protein [Mycena maculata]